MAVRNIGLPDPVFEYLVAHSVRDSDLKRRLREETAKLPLGMMQIGPDQGQFMALLVELIGARRALEIGTFTGYSSLCVAEAMGPQGRMICCDISEEFTSIARRYWREAGVADRIDLRLGPGVATLDKLLADGETGKFDFAFIDADKTSYDAYYERALKLVRKGGLIAIDNVLWGGDVINPKDRSEDTVAIRKLNEKLAKDDRVTLAMVSIGDGLTLARKH
ncbi:MAG TPA: class I SAM-dependent methyltransferase [Hypericibacter adhaerens]|jgi:caffeoyl-CoA O-methyltransferase|uniref:O-methyltransferase n=1 Tax=Hypericibacter adhaerens TaxID=2602016 RepID=A0A5J6N038_9PROT|nr:class I SAM-dependent methyltransferase [Hypericibacter adhaerens]QEX22483.1 O-methyltransferase [Hypericibacter adhaerens]HWA41743.1 class I SAM-dependent methyltransferase [Hypericibacter adhaerens]